MTLFNFIFSTLLMVASFTVQSKDAVAVSGTIPNGSEYAYHNSNKKGQLTASSSASLVLSGWNGTEIESVTLHMRSNKESGGGDLSMTIDGHEAWTISDAPFSSSVWYGKYTTDTVAITHTFTPNQPVSSGEISITIHASSNSLYIVKYDINYHHEAPRARTVKFNTTVGTCPQPITEEGIGEGILLPTIQWEQGDWHFEGWAEQSIVQSEEISQLLFPGKIYYPTRDIELYSIFSNRKEKGHPQASRTITDGPYMIISSSTFFTWQGGIENHTITILASDVEKKGDEEYYFQEDIKKENIYNIECVNDSTIHIFSLPEGYSIGAADKQLSYAETEWIVSPVDSLAKNIYYRKGEHTYHPVPSLRNDYETGLDILAIKLVDETVPMRTWLFFPVKDYLTPCIFTSEPARYIESIPSCTTSYGTKMIRNGNIIIRTSTGKEYNLLGTRL